MVVLEAGQKFESEELFVEHFQAFQDETKQCFSEVRSTSSTSKTVCHRNINIQKFPYYYYEYHCYYGPPSKECQSTGQRTSK